MSELLISAARCRLTEASAEVVCVFAAASLWTSCLRARKHHLLRDSRRAERQSSCRSFCRHARLQITEVFVFEETCFFKVLLLQSEAQSIMGSLAGSYLSEAAQSLETEHRCCTDGMMAVTAI